MGNYNGHEQETYKQRKKRERREDLKNQREMY